MNYCQRGREMLLDLKRSEWMPKYDDEGIRTVVEESVGLSNKISALGRDTSADETKVSMVYHQQCLMRNKRYLDCYGTHRMGKLRELRWVSGEGAILPAAVQQADLLCLDEVDYFASYNKALMEYGDAVGVDITATIEPPGEYYIGIRALVDAGEVLTESGPIKLVKGGTHFVRRTDVEDLVRQGLVEHIDA